MTKTLNNTNCSHHLPIKQSEKALFAKMICNSYDQAVALLKGRNLGPGELAVVRYYINDADEWNDATGLPVRMILGIGGANAQSDDDVFIFNDSRIFGEDYVTADDVERMIISALDLYATKDDLANYYKKSEIDDKLEALFTDTKVTANTSTGTIYLIGQDDASNGTNEIAYKNASVYMSNGALYANSASVANGATALVSGEVVYNAVQAAKSEAIEAATVYWETL